MITKGIVRSLVRHHSLRLSTMCRLSTGNILTIMNEFTFKEIISLWNITMIINQVKIEVMELSLVIMTECNLAIPGACKL